MTWTHAQASIGGNAATTTISKAITPTAAGNVVIVQGIGPTTATNLNVSDTAGWTFTQLFAYQNPSSLGAQRAWYAITPNTTANTITITTVTGTGFTAITVDEFHTDVAGATISADGTPGQNAGASPVTASTITSVAGSLIYSGFTDNWNGTAWAGWAAGGADGAADGAQYQLSGALGTITTLTTNLSGQTVVSIAALKAVVIVPADQTTKPGTVGEFDPDLRGIMF